MRDSVGYYHIELRHKAQWARLSKDKSNSGWEGLASWTLRQVLEAPMTACDVGKNKLMYVGYIVIVEKGKPPRREYVKSAISRNNKIAISVYPSRNNRECKDVGWQ